MNFIKIAESIGKVGGALAVIAGIVFYVIRAETSQMRSDISILQSNSTSTKDDIASLKSEVKSTNERIDKVLSDALNKLVANKSANIQNNKATLEKGELILSVARSVNAKLIPSALSNYADYVSKVSESATLSAVAWQSLTHTVDYRSFLNADYVPKLTDLTPWPQNDPYRSSVILRPDKLGPVPMRGPAVFFSGGYVQPEKSARLEPLANPQSVPSKIGLFVVEDGWGSVVLDGMYMKNVIVRNAKVIYEGGPVKLENVYFVNCSFTLTKSRPAVRRLSDSILRTASVDFSYAKRS